MRLWALRDSEGLNNSLKRVRNRRWDQLDNGGEVDSDRSDGVHALYYAHLDGSQSAKGKKGAADYVLLEVVIFGQDTCEPNHLRKDDTNDAVLPGLAGYGYTRLP